MGIVDEFLGVLREFFGELGDLLLVERVVVDPDEEGEDSHRTGTLSILLQQAMSGEFFARNSVRVWL